MTRRNLTIILALALIACFFLPFYKSGGSGLDIVKGAGSWEKYLLLAFPVCGIFLLLGELNNNYLIARSFLTWLPFLVILFIILINPLIQGVKFDQIIKAVGKGYGSGMWLAIISSVLLAFYNPSR